jgi:hypothetical protein
MHAETNATMEINTKHEQCKNVDQNTHCFQKTLQAGSITNFTEQYSS